MTDEFESGLPRFVKWFNRILAWWAGVQATACSGVGVAIAVYGADVPAQEMAGAPLMIGLLMLSIVGGLASRATADRVLRDAGPVGHMVATMVFGVIVMATLLLGALAIPYFFDSPPASE